MTREEAEALIARVVRDEIGLQRSLHARDRMVQRDYTILDVLAVLENHTVVRGPHWSPEHQDHLIVLRGICTEGRPTRVVLALRPQGHCLLVTIMPTRPARRAPREDS